MSYDGHARTSRSRRTGTCVGTCVPGYPLMETYPIILIANEPGAYRSLLVTELPLLRPNLRVVEVSPGEIDAAVSLHRPAVILSSRRVAAPHDLDVAMLVLYPDGDDTFFQSFQGTERAIRQPRLSDILDAIDRVVATPRA